MEAIHAEDPKPLQHVVAVGLLQKVGGRKNYSLAPCHHLFVRDPYLVGLFGVTHSSLLSIRTVLTNGLLSR